MAIYNINHMYSGCYMQMIAMNGIIVYFKNLQKVQMLIFGRFVQDLVYI